MDFAVPIEFSQYLRVRRARVLGTAVSLLALFSALTQSTALTMALAMGCVALIQLLRSKLVGLRYHVSREGVQIRIDHAGNASASLAFGFGEYWIDLRRDDIREVDTCYWCGEPAILIRTRRNPRGFVMPTSQVEFTQIYRSVVAIYLGPPARAS